MHVAFTLSRISFEIAFSVELYLFRDKLYILWGRSALSCGRMDTESTQWPTGREGFGGPGHFWSTSVLLVDAVTQRCTARHYPLGASRLSMM